MKAINYFIGLWLLVVACQPAAKNTNPNFEKNAATVEAYLKSFQAEKVDYSGFSDNFWALNTAFGAPSDSISFADFKANDARMLAAFDFKMLGDSIVFLPGVDSETKMLDGSVRIYSEWQATRPATDSSSQKVAVLKMYESYDFDENGKIVFQQGYGDFSGAMNYLMSK